MDILKRWELIRANKKTRRIILAHAVAHDQEHRNSSLVRGLEMAVDAATDFAPGYTAQFFVDSRIYNLVEAVIYLENMLYTRQRYAAKLGDLNQVRAKVAEILEKFSL